MTTEKTWWELRARRESTEWGLAGTTSIRSEVDAFLARGKAEGFEVQVWLVTERTETTRKLEEPI